MSKLNEPLSVDVFKDFDSLELRLNERKAKYEALIDANTFCMTEPDIKISREKLVVFNYIALSMASKLVKKKEIKNMDENMKKDEENKITTTLYTDFFHQFIKREKLITTGMGLNVAISPILYELTDICRYDIKKPEFGIYLIRHGVEWQSLDQIPVKIIFPIIASKDSNGSKLHIATQISLVMKNKEYREKLLNENSSKAVRLEFMDAYNELTNPRK